MNLKKEDPLFYTHCSRFGNTILHKYVTSSGNRRLERVSKFPISLYTPSKYGDHVGLGGVPLEKESYESLEDAKTGTEGRKMWGQTDLCSQFISHTYPGTIPFDTSGINIVYIDIETEIGDKFPEPSLAEQAITAIALKSSNQNTVVALGLKHIDTPIPAVRFEYCGSEPELLRKFLVEWRDADIDVVVGWNSSRFDIPYIVNRIRKVLGDKAVNALSPFGKYYNNGVVREKKLVGDEIGYEIVGIADYDYMDLYKKFSNTRPESYSLNYIAYSELGEKKVDYSEEGSLRELAEKNYQKFIEYNVHDALLVEKLEAKLRFINIALTMVYMTKARHQDAFGMLKLWDSLLYNKMLDKGIQIPNDIKSEEAQIVGGYVKAPIIGLHKWIVSFDLASLYPSIIIQHNLSPETLEKDATGDNIHKFLDRITSGGEPVISGNRTILANGSEYSKDKKGIFPEISVEMFLLRKEYKAEMLKRRREAEECDDPEICERLAKEIVSLDAMQGAIKVLMNSLYGAVANPHFRYYNTSIAEGITMTGQLVIQYAERKMNEYLNGKLKREDDRVIAVDTDSLFVNLSDFHRMTAGSREDVCLQKVIDMIDTFCKKDIEPKLAEWFQDFSVFMNAPVNRMHMKREKIIDSGLWRAKKNYVIQVWDNEGVRYHEAKIVPVGIEIARGSTPEVVKTALRESIKLILNSNEESLIQFVSKFREEFFKAQIQDISFPRGVSNPDKWKDPELVWMKGTPIHIKGVLTYNNLLKSSGLALKPITSGDKIKFIYLKDPNPVRCNVISFPSGIPGEFGLDEYIDRGTQFQKAFLNPVSSFTDIIGWKYEKSHLISDFFGDFTEVAKPARTPDFKPVAKQQNNSIEGFF